VITDIPIHIWVLKSSRMSVCGLNSGAQDRFQWLALAKVVMSLQVA
jgi:hypothetical protein